METLLAMQIAAALTNAACNGLGLGTNRLISPDLTSDPTQKTLDLKVWEIFRSYYNAIVQALADPADWPTPKIAAGVTLPNVVGNGIQSALAAILPTVAPALAPLLASGPVADIVKKLLSAIPAPQSPPALPSTVPDPGVPIKPAS